MKISYFFPEHYLTNEDLEVIYHGRTASKIEEKIGFRRRYRADGNTYSSDLALRAANNMMSEFNLPKSQIELMIVCTQSPDFNIPSIGPLIQHNLGLSSTTAVIDVNQGCSGFIYCLAIAQSLIMNGVASNALILTVDTYSKHISKDDFGNQAIFSDAACATFIDKQFLKCIGRFILGSDGSGANKLFSNYKSLRKFKDVNNEFLFMDGPEIFNFTIQRIPELFHGVLDKNQLSINDVDFFVFHQANKYILDHLAGTLKIPKTKMIFNASDFGNTVSSTIPISLKTLLVNGVDFKGKVILILGFGVGYSWGGTILDFR